MTTSTPGGPPSRLSVPPKFAAPRQLTSDEVSALRAIADVLIPASGDNPAATSEPNASTRMASVTGQEISSDFIIADLLA